MATLAEKTYTFLQAPGKAEEKDLKEAVHDGFEHTPKQLSPRFFYDERGSELFAKIMKQPEYYPPKLETEILSEYAEEMLTSLGEHVAMVEFGAGNSEKTRILLEEGLRLQTHLQYMPIDISGEFLRNSAEELIQDYGDGLCVTAIAGRYREALNMLPVTKLPKLMVMLGSTIGNYRMDEIISLLSDIESAMDERDRFLLGIDLVKDPDIIEAAYNDEQGVTAKFNKNILRRINNELNANFDLNNWKHYAPYLEDQQKVEMRLYSQKPQEVRIEALDRTYQFEEEEYIHTENSTKFTRESLTDILDKAGLELTDTWTESQNHFGVVLLRSRR